MVTNNGMLHSKCYYKYDFRLGRWKKYENECKSKNIKSNAKKNSKTQQEKREMAKKNYRPRIVCEKCKNGNVTLYNVEGHYICKNCKDKEEK